MKAFLLALFDFFTGAHYLPHRRCFGGVTLVNLTGYQWGVEANETGINVESFEATYKPEQKEYLKDRVGSKIGFAVDEPEGEFNIAGEVSGSTGLMAATFASAVTIANDTAEFGLTSGGVYLDEASPGQSRNGFRRITFKLSKNKGIA